ncbi:MAG: hypothetical protein Ct9H300mP16_08860 [Pseudomonadota bacterium]|nr:MAG: hypothetical protein Ct9H300mP16_08860 [Pseudomonadota bacterium]
MFQPFFGRWASPFGTALTWRAADILKPEIVWNVKKALTPRLRYQAGHDGAGRHYARAQGFFENYDL